MISNPNPAGLGWWRVCSFRSGRNAGLEGSPLECDPQGGQQTQLSSPNRSCLADLLLLLLTSSWDGIESEFPLCVPSGQQTSCPHGGSGFFSTPCLSPNSRGFQRPTRPCRQLTFCTAPRSALGSDNRISPVEADHLIKLGEEDAVSSAPGGSGEGRRGS